MQKIYDFLFSTLKLLFIVKIASNFVSTVFSLAKTALLAQIFNRSMSLKDSEKLSIEAVFCRFCQTDVGSLGLC
jgi:hypothetical protein